MNLSEALTMCAASLLDTEIKTVKPVRGTCVTIHGSVFDVDTVGKNVHLTRIGVPGTPGFGSPSVPSVCSEIVLVTTSEGAKHLVGASIRPVRNGERIGPDQLEGTGEIYTAKTGEHTLAVRAYLTTVALREFTEFAEDLKN